MSAGTQAEKGRTFRTLHEGPQILMLPNAWDVGTAVMMAQAGWPALATTSSGIAFALGYRDGERMERSLMLEAVRRIAAAVDLPVTADLETGYGAHPRDVAETIRLAIAAGAVGVNLEDSPVRGIAPLLEPAEACERIRAAREAADASGVPFVLNARTDPYLRLPKADPGENFAEAVRRAHAYLEAGADCIFVPGSLPPETMGRLAKEIPAPLNVLGAYSGRSGPALSELQALGVRRVSIGGSLALAVLTMVRRAMQDIRERGTFDYAEGALTNSEMNRLLER